MLLRLKRYCCWMVLAAALFPATLPAAAEASSVSSSRTAATLDLRDIGKGAVPLDGNWQFHLGDDPAWASPALDDSGWEQLQADRPWGVQSHPAYSGFAWYRLHIRITPAPETKSQYLLLMPPFDDAYQVYWNGVLIGHIGELPPHASWPAVKDKHIFGFPAAESGVLAIRVWKSPPGSSDSGNFGGPQDAILLGDSNSIRGQMAIWDYGWLRSNLYSIGLNILYSVVACLALLMWLRSRNQTPLLWFALFTGCPFLWGILYGFRLPFDSIFASTVLQPLFALRNVALWFLLLSLLQLESNRLLYRWAKVLAFVSLAAGTLDGLLGLTSFVVGWSVHAWAQWTDAVLTAITTIIEVFPLIIIALAIRRKLSPGRWAVASTAFLSHMILVATSASEQGERFTHWTFSRWISTPLFFVKGMYFNAQILADTALFLSIIYTIYRFGREQSIRRSQLEYEIQRAREIQQSLIPEAIPPLQGYALTSAYQPAQDVGGDFFQVIPCEDGSTLIALGDVSGKGLHAAMSVSMILGVLRTLADSTVSPATILAGLNRRMYGRMADGFATAIVVRVCPNGALMLASAGHLSPFLNHRELPLPGSLPLGITPALLYEETRVELHIRDQLSLYTDGLLEARSSSGELYGFERVHNLFAGRPTAEHAAQEAIRFGQDDDITVLTITRLATGEESSAFNTTSALASSE